MKSIQTITPIRIYKNKDGTLSRDLDRLRSHIYSIKNQSGDFEIDVVIGDSSYNDDVKEKIKKVCEDMGAIYLHNGALDLFNRGIAINKTFNVFGKKTDFVALFDLDHVIVDRLFLVFLSKTKKDRLLTCGVHFLNKRKVSFDETSSSLIKYTKKSELSRFRTAKGLQFWQYDDFLNYGGVDANFNLYCGTDDEILYRIPETINVNNPSQGMAFHIDHDKFELPKHSELVQKFCKINRYYLSRYTKEFVFQNNLTSEINYLCYNPNNHSVYWGTEDKVLIKEEEFLDMGLMEIISLYLENRK